MDNTISLEGFAEVRSRTAAVAVHQNKAPELHDRFVEAMSLSAKAQRQAKVAGHNVNFVMDVVDIAGDILVFCPPQNKTCVYERIFRNVNLTNICDY